MKDEQAELILTILESMEKELEDRRRRRLERLTLNHRRRASNIMKLRALVRDGREEPPPS